MTSKAYTSLVIP